LKSQVLFIHIPKTAGSSINSSPLMSKVDKKIHPFRTTINDKIIEIGAEDFFKFCFVRNPYARFYSLYNYFYHMNAEHIFYKYNGHICEVVQRFRTFSDFVHNFKELRIRNNFHFYPQSDYVYCEGELVADFIGKVENIDHDINDLAKLLDLAVNIELSEVNVSTKKDAYKQAYTEQLKMIVQDIYGRDFDNFGYDR